MLLPLAPPPADNLTLCCTTAAPDASNAFAVITIFEDYIEIAGQGSVTSRTLPLN